MSVPSCKGTLLQGCGRPWYRGYGTTQEQRTWLFGQPPEVIKTTTTASSCSNQLRLSSNYEANFICEENGCECDFASKGEGEGGSAEEQPHGDYVGEGVEEMGFQGYISDKAEDLARQKRQKEGNNTSCWAANRTIIHY